MARLVSAVYLLTAVCVLMLCLLHWALGGVTKDKEEKIRLVVRRTGLAHRGVCVLLKTFFWHCYPLICPARILLCQTLADYPISRGVNRLWPHLWQIPLTNSFHSRLPLHLRKQEVLSHFLFLCSLFPDIV